MADDQFPYQYRYHGGSPKVFTARSKSGEQLLNPGEVIDSDAPLHHGELEPLSQAAKDFAAANDLRLERDGGDAWADKHAAANGLIVSVGEDGAVQWAKASKPKPPASETSAAAPAPEAPKEG